MNRFNNYEKPPGLSDYNLGMDMLELYLQCKANLETNATRGARVNRFKRSRFYVGLTLVTTTMAALGFLGYMAFKTVNFSNENNSSRNSNNKSIENVISTPNSYATGLQSNLEENQYFSR